MEYWQSHFIFFKSKHTFNRLWYTNRFSAVQMNAYSASFWHECRSPLYAAQTFWLSFWCNIRCRLLWHGPAHMSGTVESSKHTIHMFFCLPYQKDSGSNRIIWRTILIQYQVHLSTQSMLLAHISVWPPCLTSRRPLSVENYIFLSIAFVRKSLIWHMSEEKYKSISNRPIPTVLTWLDVWWFLGKELLYPHWYIISSGR